MRKSIDHYVSIVDDLDAAREAYHRLGFNVRPPALHVKLGSSNCVVIFPDTYLELIHIGDAPPWLADAYLPRLQAGPGLCHVSLTAHRLNEEHERLAALGYAADTPASASRKVIMPDGREDQTDSNFMYNWKPERRYVSLFFSEHLKPETIFISGHTTHPNGAVDTKRIVAVSEEPTADRPYYQDSYGYPAAQSNSDGFVMLGGRGDAVEVLTPEAAQRRYAPLLDGLELAGLGGFPVALHLSVHDIAATRAYLADVGVAFTEFASGLATARTDGVGNIIVFEPKG
ncbi:MAG: VOC family protein [Pseudomonadota bacterium]